MSRAAELSTEESKEERPVATVEAKREKLELITKQGFAELREKLESEDKVREWRKAAMQHLKDKEKKETEAKQVEHKK